ncbi:TonB-dependent siderophore receptor [Azovibrio restrictus]|uniref:TonB-dependent siderophore receptor n=1 Tax=Azovibrio restrictus TaxID=146938 RepID=UPI0026F2F696|nr:TonB-dependent receptor [Azovibrio restrictus]MDD3483186.1 TonB-dependent receptor [Azovibrio restrictus]
MTCQPRSDASLNRMLRCAVAVSLALASLSTSAQSGVATGSALESAASRNWDIPAGPLADTLARIARDSGQRLSADPALVAGRTAAPVRGKFSPVDAARQALAGTGLELLVTEGGTLSLRLAPVRTRDGEAMLAPMLVTAAQAGEGSVERGYVSKKISPVGPWEGRSLLDTPYAINTVSAELIENIQASSPDQIFKMNPTTQLTWPTLQNDNPYVFLRGFQSSTSARNGLPRETYGHGTSTEDVERVEVLTGLSGFLYGAGNVGGIINYVSKRPTKERYNSLTTGYTGGQNAYVHGDFGGPIDADGRFGYRINAVVQDGETRVDNFNLKKNFLSAAFDWHATDRLLIQVDASRRDFRSQRQPYWYMAAGVARPDADKLDPTKLWSQPWTYTDVESTRLGANLRWELNDAVALRASYLDQNDLRKFAYADNTVRADGTYNQSGVLAAPQEQKTIAYNGFVDVKFATGGIQHKLTGGHIATSWRRYDYVDNGSTLATLSGASLDAPHYVEKPAWASVGQGEKWERLSYRKNSWMIGDDIAFNEQWSLLAGVNRATIDNEMTWASPSAAKSSYRKSVTTPTISLVYKPVEQVTTYASYMESLEQGGIADLTYGGYPVTNAGALLDPLMSEQIEVGAKASLGGMLVTGALFQIDKGLQYYDLSDPTRPTYVQSGRQVHKGIELTATGKLTRNLTLIGGLTLLDASVKENKQNPALEGKRPVGVAEKMFKIYGEYTIPGFEKLTLNGGINYVGEFYGDNANTDRMPGYALLDLGLRYTLAAGEYPLTLRLNVNNVTDKRYWVNQYYLGDARTVVMSANLRF